MCSDGWTVTGLQNRRTGGPVKRRFQPIQGRLKSNLSSSGCWGLQAEGLEDLIRWSRGFGLRIPLAPTLFWCRRALHHTDALETSEPGGLGWASWASAKHLDSGRMLPGPERAGRHHHRHRGLPDRHLFALVASFLNCRGSTGEPPIICRCPRLAI